MSMLIYLAVAGAFAVFCYVNILIGSIESVEMENAKAAMLLMGSAQAVMGLYLLLNIQHFHRASWGIMLAMALGLLCVVFSLINQYSKIVYVQNVGILVSYSTLWAMAFGFNYLFIRKNPQSLGGITMIYWAVFFVMFVAYFQTSSEWNSRTSLRVLTTSSSYYVLLLLPWWLLSRRKLLHAVGMLITCFAVVYSNKRAGLVAFAAAGFAYMVFQLRVTQSARLARLFAVIVMVVGSIVTIDYFEAAREGRGVLARFSNITEDAGSGRWQIYQDVWELQSDSSIGDWVIGHGYMRLARMYKTSAHNDFLEVLFDYGVICLMLYVALHIWVIVSCFRLFRERDPRGPALGASYAIFLVMSTVSHLIVYPTYFIFLVAFWGALSASCEHARVAGSAVALGPAARWPERAFLPAAGSGMAG